MNPKVVYIAIAIILVLAAGAVLLNNSKDKAPDSFSQEQTNQEPNTTMQDPAPNNTSASTEKGCGPDADFTQKDANGRFKPTIDISGKTAVLDTTMGQIAIQLYEKDAPKTVQNFVCLIQRGYYDGIKFHRVAHGFVIQAGDPTGTGRGGESIYGAKFEDELYADTPSYKAGYTTGVVAMANAGPNTNGSQFFILLSDAGLPPAYTIFGKVSSGMDVVAKIGQVPITPQLGPEDGAPVTAVVINKATIK